MGTPVLLHGALVSDLQKLKQSAVSPNANFLRFLRVGHVTRSPESVVGDL
jgi:hypothetical protein